MSQGKVEKYTNQDRASPHGWGGMFVELVLNYWLLLDYLLAEGFRNGF